MNDFETAVNITSESNYTFPSDGYLKVQSTSATGTTYARVNGSSAVGFDLQVANYQAQALFVRKGMKFGELTNQGGATATASFTPLV